MVSPSRTMRQQVRIPVFRAPRVSRRSTARLSRTARCRAAGAAGSGGENFWWVARQPRAVAAGFLFNGPLTQNLSTGQVQLWNGATGRLIPLNVPADANFVAAGRDRVIWWSCGASCRLQVTDLTTGTDAAVPLPGHWLSASQTYPPAPASFRPPGPRPPPPPHCTHAPVNPRPAG